jgi:hypothetical protein
LQWLIASQHSTTGPCFILVAGKSSVFAMLASSVALPDKSAMTGAMDAMVGRASSLISRRRSLPPPQPINIPMRLLHGQEAFVGATTDTSLEQLQLECQKAAGVPPELQRICIQGAELTEMRRRQAFEPTPSKLMPVELQRLLLSFWPAAACLCLVVCNILIL